MRNVLGGVGMFLKGLVMVINLVAGAVIPVIASLLGKMQDLDI